MEFAITMDTTEVGSVTYAVILHTLLNQQQEIFHTLLNQQQEEGVGIP